MDAKVEDKPAGWIFPFLDLSHSQWSEYQPEPRGQLDSCMLAFVFESGGD